MLSEYHRQICIETLGEEFTADALEIIIHHNIRQDKLVTIFWYYERHAQDEACGQTYIDRQRALIVKSIKTGKIHKAQKNFGRLLHAAHDYYAHTAYVWLWAKQFPDGKLPPVTEFNGTDPALFNHKDMTTAKTYLIRDSLYFYLPLRQWVLDHTPLDSHAHMNLDEPTRGPLFKYAIEGAKHRTIYELDLITTQLTAAEQANFKGR